MPCITLSLQELLQNRASTPITPAVDHFASQPASPVKQATLYMWVTETFDMCGEMCWPEHVQYLLSTIGPWLPSLQNSQN